MSLPSPPLFLPTPFARAAPIPPRLVALPTLPHALLYEICAYMWPGDVARLTSAARGLGAAQDENGTNLISNGMSFFRPSKQLTVVVVEDIITRRLPFCKALRVLDLSSAELTPNIILTLGRLAAEEGNFFQTVRSLNLFDNKLRSEGCLALAQALERGGFRSGLQGLYVRANQIGGDDYGGGGGEGEDHIAVLCEVLKCGACSAPLTSLSLAQNDLGTIAALHIGGALGSISLKRLLKLDLHLNQLGDCGATSVAEGLAAGGGMPCLDEFYLGFNGIGDTGARAVADCLAHMPMLRELDLACNAIGNEGALALAERLSVEGGKMRTARAAAVSTMSTTAMLQLETLDLRGNRIGDDGACAFRDFLATETTDGGLGGEEGNGGQMGEVEGGCPNLANIFLDDNRAIRARGREALQALQIIRGIVCIEGPNC